MRLKTLYISQYKNLKDFTLTFDGTSFIDVFVGKNATGKSNLFEALIEIFRHIQNFDSSSEYLSFNFSITYEIAAEETIITWNDGVLSINGSERRTIGKTPQPENILVYYSGHNEAVTNLIEKYETSFSRRIQDAEFDESRYFIGVGSDYKELLLSVLLMQSSKNQARQFIQSKLGIEKMGLLKPGTTDRTEPVIRVEFSRPRYAKRAEYNIEDNSDQDRYWRPRGITKTFLDRLTTCLNSTPGGVTVRQGYFPEDDKYILYFDINMIQVEFKDLSTQELFRQFDNLKILGMLTEISIPLELRGGIDANITHFSDGQFQSVYIYSIIELFKDRDCITLLDEPDSFLHPEWQFDFLNQVFEITATATKNNHILMSSHSASTITTASENVISLFEFDGSNVTVTKVNKTDVIKSLSAGLISFTEGEARLNIHHVLKNTSGPVLFTEGITDEIILETAWSKLYPGEKRMFEVQNAFGSGFLRSFMKGNRIYQDHPGRRFFSLFDFDEAYNDWSQLGQDIGTDPHKCLLKKHNVHDSYAILLPVPTSGQILHQVINPYTGRNYGSRSLLTMELLFHGAPGLEQYFTTDVERTDGFIKFIGDGQKVAFAKDIVPTLDAAYFEVLRPIFDFIRSKCT